MSGAAQHHGFQFTSLLGIPAFEHHPEFAAGAVGSLVVFGAFLAYKVAAPKMTPASANDKDFVPASNLGNRNLLDLCGSFILNIARENIGPHFAEFLPLLIFIFMWTLVNNLLGLFPGFGSSTDTLNTTLAMAAVTFVYYNYVGFKHGGIKYLEHYTGHLPKSMIALAFLMVPIELISHLARPISLGIRLRSNIFGDHMVYGIISDLIKSLGDAIGIKLGIIGQAIGWVITALGPVPIVALGIMVCVIQAFVFTLLTTIYIGIATAHHDDGHH